MLDQDLLIEEAVFRVGEVVAVVGRQIKVRVDRAKNGSHLLYRGQLLRNVSVGGYVKISKGFSDLIGKVDGEEITPHLGADPYQAQRDRLDRTLTVSLIGFVTKDRFRRGVRELPLVGNECFLLSDTEFDRIHSFVSERDTPISIGKLAMEKEQLVRVGVNALFASHIGIFGNTGSGKSYTLAKLYHEMFEIYGDQPAFHQKARVLIIDFNGEYVNAEGAAPNERCGSVIAKSELKTEYVLSTRTDTGDRLPLPKEALEDPTIWTVLLDATEKTQAPFLTRALRSEYWERRLGDANSLTEAIASIVYTAIRSSDATLEKSLIVQFLEEVQGCFGDAAPGDLGHYVEDIRTRLHYHSANKTYYYVDPSGTTIWSSDQAAVHALAFDRFAAMTVDPSLIEGVERIRFKIVLQYYNDVFKGFANREHLGPLIKRLESRMPQIRRVLEVSADPILATPLTVVSLRGVNLEMRKVIPLLICRQLYDAKKGKPGSNQYLNIVIDEAHNILSNVSTRESEAWKDYRLETFEEIIKEGRKFGVFLTIASQRPHDISETIISQLHNYFLHRLVNNLDILAVQRAVSYLDQVSFESLPILPTGSCVLSGMSTHVPLVIDIDPLDECNEPNNRTMTLADGWQGEADLLDDEPGDDWGLQSMDLEPDPDEPPF